MRDLATREMSHRVRHPGRLQRLTTGAPVWVVYVALYMPRDACCCCCHYSPPDSDLSFRTMHTRGQLLGEELDDRQQTEPDVELTVDVL